MRDRESGIGGAMDRLDLRRTPPAGLASRLVERACWLGETDRALVEAVYRDHRPVAEIARLRGEEPRTLRKRLRALAERLLSPRTEFVAEQLAAGERAGWGPTRRRIAQRCLLQGASLRAAAAELGLTLHEVRRHCMALHELFAEDRRRTRQSRAALRRILADEDDAARGRGFEAVA